MRRHVHAEAIADYFATNPEAFDDKLESLFDPSSSRPDELKGYLAKHPEHLKTRLNRIVPRKLQFSLGIDSWAWLDGYELEAEDKRESFVERINHAAQDVCDDWTALQQAQRTALQQEKGKLADFYLQQLNTLKRRSLLGKLGTYGLMPKYGFPTEVVELKIRTSAKESGELELDRDMKLALSEFAPGNEVIAGGKIWRSEAIVLPSGDRKLHEFPYWHCNECRFFSAENIVATGQASIAPEKICYCGDSQKAKMYLYPEFGFSTASGSGSDVGDERPAMKSYSDVFFHDDATESAFVPITGVPKISFREAKQGWLHVINRNQDEGFYICKACGFAQREFPVSPAHKKPWTSDQQCSNKRLEPRSLGYRYRTDVLELRMPVGLLGELGIAGPDNSHALWLSVMCALVNGACHALDIDERDLGGCLYYSQKYHPSVVLFDTAPGGAGFVHDVRDQFINVIERALNLLDCKSCGVDSSCIACLRTYFNQRDHNRLRRGWAKAYLEKLL
jgi:hypothetical protein